MIDRLRESDVRALAAAYEAVAEKGRGRLVFLAGDDSAGRLEVLHGCAERLRTVTPRPAILGGSFSEGLYVPWAGDLVAVSSALTRLASLLALGESAVSLGELIAPAAVTKLLGQILSKSKAALELAAASISGQSPPEDPQLLPRLLRRVCEERPAVCFIDVGDESAQGLWADLAALFSRRLARDLPLLLVFALDGPKHLGAHEEGEPDVLNIARQLSSAETDIASWHWLAPLGPKELERWTGRADREVIRSLLDITSGQGGWTAELWQDWRRRDVVEDTTDGQWRFAASGQRKRLDDVDDAFDQRLRRRLHDAIGPIAGAESILACGALEGQRFTAAAVAEALERDPDEVIDFIDDFLLVDDVDVDGFLVEEGFAEISDERGPRALALYRFARNLDWLALRDHGLSVGERQHLSRRLADALQRQYGGQVRQVSPALARLYGNGAVAHLAAHYRQMAELGVTRSLLLWRAHNSLESSEPVDKPEKARRCQLLIAAAEELADAGPFSEGLRFGEAALALADRPSDRARAHALCGNHLLHLGSYAKAREELDVAQDLFASLRQTPQELGARYGLAQISFFEGDFDKARAELEGVSILARANKNTRMQAMAHRSLAHLALNQGRFAEARNEGLAAKRLFEELGSSQGQALVLQCLGEVDLKQGHYNPGRMRLRAAIDTYRRLHRPYPEAVARLTLADACRRLGEYSEARRECEAVLSLQTELGDERGQADAYLELGLVEYLLGNETRGRQHLNTALGLARERGDKHSESWALHNLLVLDSPDEAGASSLDAETMLSQHRSLGNREGEARVLLHLAGLHGAEGKLDQARAEIDAILRICAEEGDRHLEAHALCRRGVLNLSEARPKEVDTDLQKALDLFQQIGDSTGEEMARAALEAQDQPPPTPIGP